MYYETRKIYIAKLLRVCIDAWLLLFTSVGHGGERGVSFPKQFGLCTGQ